ncbi:hypothetical protein KFU94_39780 [Chloroflexi bacterium TSY]|nr:hypothetical protein [Chloroflexi bacterium TSY]
MATDLVLEAEDSADGCILRRDGIALASDGSATDEGAIFSLVHGPAELPSVYLERFKENGWVALPCILDAGTIEELERPVVLDAGEQTYDRGKLALTENSAVARAAAEPLFMVNSTIHGHS